MGSWESAWHACLPPAARSTLDPPENVGFVPGPPYSPSLLLIHREAAFYYERATMTRAILQLVILPQGLR